MAAARKNVIGSFVVNSIQGVRSSGVDGIGVHGHCGRVISLKVFGMRR